MSKKSCKAGEPDPSNEDRLLTSKSKEACELVGINLTDHIIVGNGKYTSLADRREM
jgi:DNA repair protein RadC